MELSATYQKISELRERLDILSLHLELEEKQDRLEEVQRELENSEIWNDINQFISEWYSPIDEMALQTSGSTGKPKSISVKK